jgi:hypothetical protein
MGLDAGLLSVHSARWAYWGHHGPDLNPPDACARSGAPKRVWGGPRWRRKAVGHLPRVALSGAWGSPAQEQVVLGRCGCSSPCLGQYLQYIHILPRYDHHTYTYIQYIHIHTLSTDTIQIHAFLENTCTYIQIHTYAHEILICTNGDMHIIHANTCIYIQIHTHMHPPNHMHTIHTDIYRYMQIHTEHFCSVTRRRSVCMCSYFVCMCVHMCMYVVHMLCICACIVCMCMYQCD